MRRFAPILAVLLVASALLNVGLAVRLSRTPEPAPAPSRAVPTSLSAVDKKEDAAALRESLEQERKKTADLQARIERLETDKKVLAQDAPGVVKTDKIAAFREKLRRLLKIMKDPSAKSGALDPEAMTDATETMMEFMKMAALRAKEPRTYGQYLHAFYEIGLESEGTALSPDQSAGLSALFQEFGDGLAKIPPTPPGDRLLGELELEKGMMSRLNGLLTEPQRKALTAENMQILAVGNVMSTSYVARDGGAELIAQQWTAAYKLDAAQLPQAKLVAQEYLDALARLEGPGTGARTSTPEAYDVRIAALREQMAALQRLQGSMTAEQQERLRSQPMREIRFLDAIGRSEASAPEEK